MQDIFDMARNQRGEQWSAGASNVAESEQRTVLDGTWHGLFIKATVNGARVEALVDTGSTHSFIARRIYDTIDSSSKPPLSPLDEPMMMADGSLLAMDGKAKVALQLGLLSYTADVIVADIRHEGILGLDFLRGSRSVVDCYRHKLHTPCGTHECYPRLVQEPVWARPDTGRADCWCFGFCK